MSGNDIHLAGNDTSNSGNSFYWKVTNGIPPTAAITLANGSEVKGIALSGSDVYVVGVNNIPNVLYWKITDGTPSGAKVFSNQSSLVSAVAVSGGDVYIAGQDGGDTAVYWKNEVKTALSQSTNVQFDKGIAVSGNNVYVTGTDGSEAVCWVGGQRVLLSSSGEAMGAVVDGGDVYIAGAENGQPVYWRMEGDTVTKNSLPKTKTYGYATKIFIE